jgi:hypothetical protein
MIAFTKEQDSRRADADERVKNEKGHTQTLMP